MKLFGFISSILSKFTANGGVMPLLGDSVSSSDFATGANYFAVFVEYLGELLFTFIYSIISFLLSIIDVIQIAIYKFLGVAEYAEKYVVIDENNVIVKFLTSDVVTKAFRYITIVSLILIIVYTVIAVVISEYKSSITGQENKKSGIASRSLRSILMLTIFPMLLLAGIFFTNAMLAGFNNVFSTNSTAASTIGSNVFVLSSTSANKYRIYGGQVNNSVSAVRIPILIDFEDPYKNGSVHGYTEAELLNIYDNFQYDGENLYRNFAYNDFDKFGKTVVYKNNKLYNTSKYEGFEQFVATPEQYQVMADFVEYAMTNGIAYYVKNIRDDDIEWKYVDKAVFDKDETKLTITYRDASDINDSDDIYTVEYVPSSVDVSTPISDAFDTISNILAIGDYEDNLFSIMDRQDDSINVVEWETDKVYLKLSDNYDSKPTYVDMLLLYEFNRYNFNNTLDYSIDQLESGVYLPLYQIEKRAWRNDLLDYVTTETVNVVSINGTYYRVYQPDLTHATKDKYGDLCWEIVNPVSDIGECPDHGTCTEIDYHTDGTVCTKVGCTETHVHKASVHLSALEKCEDVEHYTEICADAGCREVHYAVNEVVCTDLSCNSAHYHKLASGEYESGKETPYEYCTNLSCGKTHYHVTFSQDSSGTLHHYYNNYPKCDGTNCETHNHYHFDGSKFTVCYDACYEKHYDVNGTLKNSVTAGEVVYHAGTLCSNPYCEDSEVLAGARTCNQKHYHVNGDECSNFYTCAESYHRHTKAVCGLEHTHDDGDPCGSYQNCTENYHKHNDDWNCNDKNCIENHYHRSDGTLCKNFDTCAETDHRHAPCDGCFEDHYYYVDPYYEKCDKDLPSNKNCNKYHYHLSDDGKNYIDCDDESCMKTHYHYIYPTDDNCVFMGQLSDNLKGHYKYTQNETFVDIITKKLNGSFNSSIIVDGLEISNTSYYDDIMSPVVKRVNWPQKLAQDLQTLYSEININLLITSGDWLTKLSEMIGSSMRNGYINSSVGANNTQSFDSALIHPIGLMVSELFLNEIAEDRTSYFGNYEFKSSLSDQDIRALLLAIGGEENYRQLSLQVEYFVNMFNTYMEPVLEEVAIRENFQISEGRQVTEELFTYKAYLATIMMSETCMKYLFDCTLAYIGASNFSYAVLENENIAVSLDKYLSEYEKNTGSSSLLISKDNYNNLPTENDTLVVPSLNFCLNVIVGYDDYNNLKAPGDDVKYDDAYEGNNGGAFVTYDFDTMIKRDDFDGNALAGEYSYAEFRELFYEIDTFFDNEYSRDWKTQLSNPAYDKNDPSTYEEPTVGNFIREFVESWLDFDTIYNQNRVDQILDIVLANLNINVVCGNTSSIESFVDTAYKAYENLSTGNADDATNYQIYLKSPDGTGILDLSIAEMYANEGTYSQVDYEYLKSLDEYVNGYMNRWEFVQSADYRKGSKYTQKLNSFIAEAEDYVDMMNSTTISGLNTITSVGELFAEGAAVAVLEEMYTTIYNNYDPNFRDEELPKTRPTAVYNTLLDYCHEYMDSRGFEPGIEWTLNKSIARIMEQAYSTSTDSTYGYKTATNVLRNVSSVIKNYFEDLTTLAVVEDPAQQKIKTNFQSLATIINEYLDVLDGIDAVNKYYITYAVNAYVSTHVNTQFDVVVNSKHYTVGGNMSGGKLAEYILGADIIREMGYTPSFVEDDYKGLISYEKQNNGGGVIYYDISEYMSYLNDFIVKFGNVAIEVYNNTNFLELSGNAFDELVIGDNPKLMKYVLDFLTQNNYLPADILLARFNLTYDSENHKVIYGVGQSVDVNNEADGNSADYSNDDIYKAIQTAIKNIYDGYYDQAVNGSTTEVKNAGHKNLVDTFVNAVSYLFRTPDDEDFDFESMTLKDLRTETIDFIIDYEVISAETDEQNQKRYLALFYLSCASWQEDYSWIDSYVSALACSDAEKESVRTQLFEAMTGIDFLEGEIEYKLNGVMQSVTGKTELSCINALKAETPSMAKVLRLAGIENRPDEELVGLEYSISFDWDAADEADGDLFIICTYDESNHNYVPFMMTNSYDIKEFKKSDEITSDIVTRTPVYQGLALVEEGGTYKNWLSEYGYYDAVTDFYRPSDTRTTCYYPILARGAFDEHDRPTAIRQNGKNIEYYRNDVVIRSASKLGLEQYYLTIEDAYSGGFVATIVNTVTKWFGGKSLSERLVESIPRFDINFSINVPYGVDDVVVETLHNGRVMQNYGFTASGLKLESLYNPDEINIVLMLFATIMIFTFIFKALWGSIARVVDITALYILGPVAISTVALKSESRDKSGNMQESSDGYSGIYDRWKQKLISTILLAFGYVFGLNIFFLLTPMVSKTQLFQTTEAFTEIPWLGGMPLGFFNAVGKLFLIIALASAIIYAPKVFSKVMAVENAFDYGAKAQTAVKNMIDEVKDSVSGQRMLDAAADAAASMKKMIPGIEIVDKVKQKIQQKKEKAKQLALKAAATAAGVSSPTIKKALDAYQKSYEKQQKLAEERKKKKEEERKKRQEAREKWEGL